MLAAQSQEQLRSDPASALQTLSVSPHSYTQTISGTVFTVTQNAELLPAGGSNANCSITESKRQSGNAYRITSTVTWYAQQKRKSPAVVASSIITPPTGSALEIDAYNAPTPTAGVSGITATIKYEGVGGAGLTLQEQTTGSEGCVVFGGIPSTEAIVEIHEISGYVTRSGARQFPTKEVTIAPNYTTHYPVVYNRGGAITAQFAYNGKTEYTHPNNEGTGEVTRKSQRRHVRALQLADGRRARLRGGRTKYNPVTEVYNPLPGTFEEQSHLAEQPLPVPRIRKNLVEHVRRRLHRKQPRKSHRRRDQTAGKSLHRAGRNQRRPGAHEPRHAQPLQRHRKRSQRARREQVESARNDQSMAVKVTNVKCAGTTPNNEPATNVKHEQTTSTGALRGGHLEYPFQPFSSEMQLCVAIATRKDLHAQIQRHRTQRPDASRSTSGRSPRRKRKR